MDWSQVLAKLAPLVGTGLGSVIGGPLGAGVGALLGPAVTAILGVDPTPEALEAVAAEKPAAVAAAVKQAAETPDITDRILALAAEETKRLAAINETARAEAASEDRFVRWARPFNIWVIGVATGSYAACITVAALAFLWSKDATGLSLLLANAGNVSIALAPCGAVAGITAWMRTREKEVGLPNGLDGVVAAGKAVAGAVRGRK